MAWIDITIGGNIWKIAGLSVIFVFLAIAYTRSIFDKKELSLTSELAGVLTYIIGAVVMIG